MSDKLPTVDLQPLTAGDLEFLPIGTPVITSGWATLKFLSDVNYKAHITRTHEGEKLDKYLDNVGFVSGFGIPFGQHLGHSSVTTYHLKHDNYRVVVRPRLDELERFYIEGYEYVDELVQRNCDGAKPQDYSLMVYSSDNPYDRKGPLGMAWYEGFLDSINGRPNPFRKE